MTADGEPILKFNALDENGNVIDTFTDDPGPFSRWGLQVGLRYMF